MDLKTKLRRWYWSHANEWWLAILVRFLKAFYILMLWVMGALAVFWFLYHFLPDEVEKKEIISLVGSLITAVIGFTVQQRKQGEEDALREVCELSSFLKGDLSEGARHYLELKERPGRAWQSPRIQDALEKAWRENTPPKLQIAMALLSVKEGQFWSEVDKIGREQAMEALKWVYKHLDEDWQQRAAELLIKMGRGLDFIKQHWQALLIIWPEISLGQSIPTYLDADLIQGIKHLGLERTPFGHEKAEHTYHLLETRIYPTWWVQVNNDNWGLYITLPKGGRTATALLLAYDALREQSVFPVYWRVNEVNFDLQEIAGVVAKVIARYIAVRPRTFIALTAPRKKAIANLLNHCLDQEPITYLRQVGLPTVGEGKRVIEEITTLIGNVPQMALSRRELLALLSNVCPHADFPRLLILADVQGTVGEETALNLYRLGVGLSRVGIILKAFVATDDPASLQAYGELIFWEERDLRELLQSRLSFWKEGEQTLEAWCDLRRWEGLPAEERLLQAARGRPGELIRLGNELLRCIGRKQGLLTPEDFDAILGATQ